MHLSKSVRGLEPKTQIAASLVTGIRCVGQGVLVASNRKDIEQFWQNRDVLEGHVAAPRAQRGPQRTRFWEGQGSSNSGSWEVSTCKQCLHSNILGLNWLQEFLCLHLVQESNSQEK